MRRNAAFIPTTLLVLCFSVGVRAQTTSTTLSTELPLKPAQTSLERESGYLRSDSRSIAGPLPYIDITLFGAKGDGITDDTVAIANAINKACAYAVNGLNIHPLVFFPPGYYRVQQIQGGPLVKTPIFELPCGNLTFQGSGTSNTLAGERSPSTRILVINGKNPSAGPVFDCRYPHCYVGTTFRDMDIEGYNQAVSFYTSTQDQLINTTVGVQNTGYPDNVALKLTNLFFFNWNGGACGANEASNQYCVLMTGERPLGAEAPLVGLAEFDNIMGHGGTFHYDQRVDTTGSGPGNMVFSNIRGWEANYTSFLYITNSTGNSGSAALPVVTNLTFNNVTAADSAGFPALIELNSAGTNLNGVIIDFSIGGNGGSPAIRNDNPSSSSVFGCNIRAGGNFSSANIIQDASGNPISGCSAQSWNGFDYFVRSGASPDPRLRSDVGQFGGYVGDAFRATFNGSRFAGVAIDPVFGLMLNDGTDFGYGASINESVRGTMDILFPKTYPPRGITGTATTGGSIVPATYYGTVYSTTTNCNSTQSAPSQQSSGVTLSGLNNAIKWIWSAPISGLSAVVGYCIAVSTLPNLNNGQWQPQQTNYVFVPGAGATSYTMTALPTSGGIDSTTSTLIPAHRFTPNAFGINTTSPVPSTLTQNGGYVCPIATKSGAYTLTTGDCRIQATGTITTITIPHTLPASGLTNIWHVFSVSGTTKLACDSGTINGASSLTVPNNTGKDVYADNANCFAQ